jgi:hypothetical protein
MYSNVNTLRKTSKLTYGRNVEEYPYHTIFHSILKASRNRATTTVLPKKYLKVGGNQIIRRKT